jgi:transcriptional regulator with XRE-family HTH domain
LSLRELAHRVGIDSTYLSKIENGPLPPPSEKVQSKLAKALNTDKGELMILAGKIPPDIAELLTNRNTLRVLRSVKQGGQMLRASDEKRRSLQKTSGKVLKNRRNLPKMAAALATTLAVAAFIWLTAPSQGLEISFPSLPSTGSLGDSYSFTSKVEIASSELLPINSVTLYIYKSDDRATYQTTPTNLPQYRIFDLGIDKYILQCYTADDYHPVLN